MSGLSPGTSWKSFDSESRVRESCSRRRSTEGMEGVSSQVERTRCYILMTDLISPWQIKHKEDREKGEKDRRLEEERRFLDFCNEE
jgi:hypothetical protein